MSDAHHAITDLPTQSLPLQRNAKRAARDVEVSGIQPAKMLPAMESRAIARQASAEAKGREPGGLKRYLRQVPVVAYSRLDM